jgi:hypothetical protein
VPLKRDGRTRRVTVRRGVLRTALLIGVTNWTAASDSVADDADPQTGPRIEIGEPAAEAVVGGKFQVSGRLFLPAGRNDLPILRVNGSDAAVVEGKWSITLTPEKEGIVRIRVVCAYPGEPATVVERPVKVDRTPPVIEFSEPAGEVGVHPEGEGRVAGVVTDANLVRVTINGHDVKTSRQGEFEETFLLPAVGETRVEVRAVDAAGNEALGVRRLRTTADPSAPPPERPTPKPPRKKPAPPIQEAAAANPIGDALKWLEAHQSPDGGWECEGFGRWCEGKPASGAGPDGAGKAMYDVGVTGLALLALLGSGDASRGDDPAGLGKATESGLRYLRNLQGDEGCYGPRLASHYVYNHAIGALAMVEAYGATGSPVYRASAQKALDFIAIARNPYFAWRYGVRPGDNDTSVTGWMMMALASGRRVNEIDVRAGRAPSLVMDEDAFDGIKTWIDKVTDDQGRAGYQTRGTGPARMTDLVDKFPAEKSESMTAIGILARMILGGDAATSKPIQDGARLCGNLAPSWNPHDGSIDLYYWYYATSALNRMGGPTREAWNRALLAAVIPRQRRDGDPCGYRGSWDPLDPWGADGGRVYSTAIIALALEHLGSKASPDAVPPVPTGQGTPAAGSAASELRNRVSRLLIAREGVVISCGECGGTGKRLRRITGGYDKVDCSACAGKGKILDRNRFTIAFWSMKSPAWRALPESKAAFDRSLGECSADLSKATSIRRHLIKAIVLADDRHGTATVLEDGVTTAESRWIWYEAAEKSSAGWYLYDAAADGPWPQ